MAHILIADDEPDLARLVQLKLARAGHRTEVVGDGRRALAALAQATLDLAVLDIGLPVLDGIEVLRCIRADPATALLPVILLTARGLQADVLRGFEAGATEYMIKPFVPSELLARVERCLAARQAST